MPNVNLDYSETDPTANLLNPTNLSKQQAYKNPSIQQSYLNVRLLLPSMLRMS